MRQSAAQTFWPKGKQAWRGIVTEVAERGKTFRLTVDLHSRIFGNYWIPADGCVETVLLKNSSKNNAVRTGDALMFYGQIEQLRNEGNPGEFDYAAYLRHKGIKGQVFAAGYWCKLPSTTSFKLQADLPCEERFRIYFLRLRNHLTERYATFPLNENERQVLAAMTLGDKAQLSHQVRQVFSRTGVSHVLALSGLHLGILVFLLLALFRPFLKRQRGKVVIVTSTLLLIWSFVFLTGMSISLMRAAVMYSLYLLMLLQKRPSNGLNSLAIAAILLLILWPNAIFDIGFQLSFLAVGSILVFQPAYQQIKPKKRGLAIITDFLYVSLAAQLATAPLVAYYFHLFPTYFLASNIVAIPCLYVLLGSSLLFFLFPFVAPLQSILVKFISEAVILMDSGLTQISLWPHAVFELYPTVGEVVITYLLIGTVIFYFITYRTRYLSLCLCMTATLICSNLYKKRADRIPCEVVFYNSYHNSSIHFIASADHSWLWALHPNTIKKDLNYIACNFWKQYDIAEPTVFKNSINTQPLKCQDGIINFRKVRVAVLSDQRWQNRTATVPIKVNYLYLCRGFKGSLSNIKRLFCPCLVVLDSSLSEYWSERFKAECKELHWPFHDISEQGGFTQLVSEKEE